jgi:hypothetical protein
MIDPPGDPDQDSEAEADFDADFAAAPDAEPATSPARMRLRAAVAITLIAAVVVFGALGGARLGRTQGGDAPRGRAPRLAAVDANGALALTDGLGGSVVAIPAPGVAFQFPVWSPDGTHVAAIGTGIKGVGVYVFDATESIPTGATAAPGGTTSGGDDAGVIYRGADRAPFYLYWSPDSRRLGFLTTQPIGISLQIAPSDGSSVATAIREGAPLYWDWIDPGRVYAHVGGSGADAFLGEMGLDGVADDATVIGHEPSLPPGSSDAPADSGQIGAAQVPGAFRAPAVSHDGRYRAFVATDAGLGQRLVIEARDGSASHAGVAGGITAMAFDPSGDSLAYVASDTSTSPFPIGPLRLVETTSGASRVLLGGKVVAFFWSPDGATIATLSVPEPGTDGVQAFSRTARLTMARARPIDAIDAAAGVGLHLAFVDAATATIRSERNVRVSDTFTNQLLPYFDQYGLSHRFWSADSVSLALPLVDVDGRDQLVVIPADGADPHPIPDRVIGFWSP